MEVRLRPVAAPALGPWQIRPATPDDELACAVLDNGYQADATWQIARLPDGAAWSAVVRRVRLPRPRRVGVERDLESYLRLFRGAAPFLVADAADTVVGWLAGWPEPEPDAIRLVECCVAPAHRRRGIGAAMLDHLSRHARGVGARYLRAHVPIHNDPAVAWLSSAGWRLTGLDERDEAEVPRLILTRRL